VHAGQPLVAFTDADRKRHVPHAQARVAKTVFVVGGATQPAAKEPEQLLARRVERVAMRGAQLGIGRLDVHEVVKALDQRAHTLLAPDPLEGGAVPGFLFDLHAAPSRRRSQMFSAPPLPILPWTGN